MPKPKPKPRRKTTRPRTAPDPVERDRLLAAADRLAADGAAWPRLSAATVTRAAGLPASRFAAHFDSREDYLVEVQQRFMDRVRDRIVERTTALPTGFERMRAASETYLDECLAHLPLRRWLVDARQRLPGLIQGLHRQDHVYGLLMAGEFRKLGWPHPGPAARLYLVALQEAGLAELDGGRALPELRETLWYFLRAER